MPTTFTYGKWKPRLIRSLGLFGFGKAADSMDDEAAPEKVTELLTAIARGSEKEDDEADRLAVADAEAPRVEKETYKSATYLSASTGFLPGQDKATFSIVELGGAALLELRQRGLGSVNIDGRPLFFELYDSLRK